MSNEARGRWIVWRQDDNGNREVMGRYPTKEEAARMVAEFEARGHKQTYWLVDSEAETETK